MGFLFVFEFLQNIEGSGAFLFEQRALSFFLPLLNLIFLHT
jgi:hypothetical protein